MRTAGSRSGRRCSDQWLVLRGVRENCWECEVYVRTAGSV